MKNKLAIIALLLYLIPFWSISQTTEELEAIFPNENAVNILRSELLTLKYNGTGIDIKYDVYQKIKVLFNTNSNDYWEENIFYGSFQNIKKVKGKTRHHNYASEFIEAIIPEPETLIESADLYSDDRNQSVYFMEAYRGANLELEYDRYVTSPAFLIPFTFVDELPSLKTQFTIRCHSDIKLGWHYHGPDYYQYHFTEEVKGNMVEYKWVMDTVATFSIEKNAPGIQELTPKIIFYVKALTKDGIEQPLLDSVSALHKWYRSLVAQTNNQSKQPINAIAKEITDTCHTDDEKIRAVFQWVQNNVKYINTSAGLGGFIPDDCVDVLRNRYGDCKAMTNLTKEILDAAGIDSYYCWVGTYDLPYTYAENFTSTTDNHMILAVGAKDDYKLLDATNSYGELYKPPYYIHGKEVLISLGPKEYIIHKVPIDAPQSNLLYDSTYLYEEEGILKGKANIKLTGSIKHTIEMAFPYKNEEVVEFIGENFKKANRKAILENIEYSGIKDRTDSMQITFDFSLSNYGQNASNNKYINLHLSIPLADDKINIDKRKFDFMFEFPTMNDYAVVYEIPEGYAVKYVPQNRQIQFAAYEFEVSYQHIGNQVIMHRHILYRDRRIKKEDFENWNMFIAELKQAYTETVVLQKIAKDSAN